MLSHPAARPRRVRAGTASSREVGRGSVRRLGHRPPAPYSRAQPPPLDRVFTDTASGKSTARPALDDLLRYARAGDTIVVHSMDRLARNLDDLRRLVRDLTARQVSVEFVTERLTFTSDDSPMATLLRSVMGAFAEFERALIRARQRGVSPLGARAP